MEPNYRKVDAALAAAIDESKNETAAKDDEDDNNKNTLEIFVHTDRNLGSAEINYLKEKGVIGRVGVVGGLEEGERSSNNEREGGGGDSGGSSHSTSTTNELPQVFTASLSASLISELSNQPWIRYLTLSHKLKLL